MIKLLDLYIARNIITSTTLTLFVLTGLSGLIQFVDKLRWAGRGDFTTWDVVIYVLFMVPRDIEMFFPIAAMLGALIAMGGLAQSSELVVMQAAGLSRLNIAMSVLKTALPLMLCIMLIGEYVAPVAEQTAREFAAKKRSGGSLISASQSGTWAKDGDYFVNIKEVINADSLVGITLYQFDDSHVLRHVTHAERAQYQQDAWQLQQVTYTTYTEAQISRQQQSEALWYSTLTPNKLNVVTVKPESLSIAGLLDYLEYLDANQQDATRYQLALWRKLAQPITVAVMMILGLSFIFGPLRSVTMGARLLMGVIAGFSFHLSNEIFGPMSLVMGLPTFLGALLPSGLFAFAAILLLRRR